MNDLLTISQEFMNVGKTGDHNSFTAKLSEIGQSIRNLFVSNNAVVASIDGRYSHNSLVMLRRELSDSQEYETYMAVRERGIKVPPGFKGSMQAYTKLLSDAVTVITELEKNYIGPIEKQLATVLADPSKFKKTVTSNCNDLGGKVFDSIYTPMADFFDGTLRSDQSSLGQNYGRLKDIDDTFDHLITAIVKLEASNITPAKMKSRAQVISSLVDKIIIRMKQKPEQFELNGVNGKMIGELTYTLARAFEFYATITNSLDIAIHAAVDSFYD